MSTSITKNYLLELRPLDYYFFGGETTFGDGEGQNYYARTRLWPQQTSLLGVLRYVLYPDYCGKNSFSFDQKGPYGSIESLSPLFFTKRMANDRTHFFLSPFGKSAKPRAVRKEQATSQGRAIYSAAGISDKEYVTQQIVDKQGNTLAIQPYPGADALCQTFDKIGITKSRSTSDQTDAFYKQTMAKLRDNFAFSSIVSLAAHLPDHLFPQKGSLKQIVTFGAEKALFELRLEPSEQTFDELFPSAIFKHDYADAGSCFLLTSDAYLLDGSLMEELDFVLTDTRSFRYINTPGGQRSSGRVTQED
ncbi:MAG: type III-B CRISPR module-associated Cmr3 family protein [Bacteroidota bacterium]